MHRLRLLHIDSIADLREEHSRWDALWERSDVAAPTGRAEPVAQWIEHFAPDCRLRTLVVAEGDQFLAALPLVGRRLNRLVEVGGLPNNCWSAAGELLVDPAADERVIRLLIEGMSHLPWPLLWLEGIHIDGPGWQRLTAALTAARIEHEVKPEFEIGFVDVEHDWPKYEATWSKNHRKAMRKTRARLEQAGTVTCHVHRKLEVGQVGPVLLKAFEVENRSWKGAAGTSVLKSHGVFDYYCRQARYLASRGELEISLLELDDEPIAFEYGYRSKQVYFSHKVGYDERYASYGPGQLLMSELLQRLHAEDGVRGVDCLGPLTDAVSRWTTRTYRCGRIIIAPRRVWGRALLASYRAAQPWARRWRQRGRTEQL